MSGSRKFDTHIIAGDRLVFLSDRFGEPRESNLAPAGLTLSQVNAAAHKAEKAMQDDVAFLVQVTRCGQIPDAEIALLVEFSLDPKKFPDENAGLDAWWPAIRNRAPALLAIARQADEIRRAGGYAHAGMNLDSLDYPYPSFFILLGLDDLDHYPAVFRTMFKTTYPEKASAHEQIELMSQMRVMADDTPGLREIVPQ